MGRLIDADVNREEFKRILCRTLADYGKTLKEQFNIIMTAFDSMQTAYDVDAVVSEIKKKYCQKCRNILSVPNAEEYCKEQKCRIDEICDIVKEGGVK